MTTTIFNLSGVQLGIHQLATCHPVWWGEYEDANLHHPDTPHKMLLGLLATAPTPFAAGLLAGRLLAAPRLF